MMKKIVSAMCAAVMAASLAGGALAATTDYTLEEKLQQQVISSGLKGTVSFNADGDGFMGIEDAQWLLVREILPAVTFDVTSTVLTASQPDRETQLTINMNGAAAGQAQILQDGETVVFSGDMIGSGKWYAAGQNADLSRIFVLEPGNEWPAVGHMLFELATADASWSGRAESAASDYMMKLGLWISSCQKITTQSVDGQVRVTHRCEITGSELKAEMKQLMVDLYSDQEMLALLAEIFTPEEAAAYLQPGMMSTFFSMLDHIDIDSDVIIERVFDGQGNCRSESVTLPFGTGSRLAHVTISSKGVGTEKEYAVTGAYRAEGDEETLYPFMIAVIPVGTEGIYTGSFSIDYPLPAEEEFTVDEQAPVTGRAEAEFALGFDGGEETYSASEDLCLRERSLTLTVRPMPGDTSGLHTLSLSVDLVLSSKSRRSAATNVALSATLTDQDLGGYIGMEASFKTASKWAPALIKDLTVTPVRVDTLSGSELEKVRADWTANLIAWFASSILPLND